jgi:hypothetical protein
MLSSHIRLDLQVLFPSGFPTKILYVFLIKELRIQPEQLPYFIGTAQHSTTSRSEKVTTFLAKVPV